ncbi:thiamine-phosphate kinase [Hephaestia sp. GCM10023244]|uniref:thiamine-phosphate kinase n=1 Tax=unclassified Hephaestia TaxID=2631281 RepID=UPI0020772B98|nr:thiamine-phosphate kinase [Hephaestia sp. MAHUQ-44]MCM8729898.1 thiamine-phosphate kinase [Hephaestia sp. MAHUQ-44]
MTEADFLAALRTLPLHPGALGLRDDVARLGDLILTTDTIVEGVHYLAGDAPADVAWKLVAVNLSDLAAKGAVPEGVLLNYPLGDGGWDRAFLAGLGNALTHFASPLLGGDTVSRPADAPRVITLTAIGRAQTPPARTDAREGDALYVTGTIGDAGAGLRIARGEPGPAELANRYHRPTPRLAEGKALAPLVHAMMDISDGLLIDAARMANASGLGITIDLGAIPLSDAYRAFAGEDRAARLAAATSGDDYELLFAAPTDTRLTAPATRIGTVTAGAGLALTDGGLPIPLPTTLGFQH